MFTMSVMSLERHPKGPRVRVFGQRLHHGVTGQLLIAIGLLLTIHDRHDWRDWFRKGAQS